jgi:hypothetical protein
MDPEIAQQTAEHFKPLVMSLTALIGVGILFAQLLLPDHKYLRGLGYAFLLIAAALGVQLFAPGTYWYLGPLLGAAAALVLAFVDAIRSTRDRIKRYQEEMRERESAFAEYLGTLAKSEKASRLLADTAPAKPTEPSDTLPNAPGNEDRA